ncbi:hypothetical protein [Silvibacterium acidisoli]|uniref:hypothetical protein n=1 Tax=Acidobacteriaceae bacterium ZG23-2 TaxID=2883246 RepID=UPI00406C4A2E
MESSTLSRLLWYAGFIETCVLTLVLLGRGRWRKFPVFSALMGFNVLRSAVLFTLIKTGLDAVYPGVYWSAACIDLVLQVTLVFEMARIVLKPTGTWVRDARKSFLLWGAVGALIAVGLSFAVSPETPTTFVSWLTKGRLFATLLMCELFASMAFASSRLGLVWRNHVMGLGQGFTVWALVVLCTDAIHSYYGPTTLVGRLEFARVIIFQAATIYWIITFWIPEPESRTLSDDMQEYLAALHRRVSVDLRSTSHFDSLS